jgi:hypothetical protein
MRTFKTIAVAGSLAALTLGVFVVPAQAATNKPNAQQIAPLTSDDCLRYLNRWGYPTTQLRNSGCLAGETWTSICQQLLNDSGVSVTHAFNACELAKWNNRLAVR